jgi:uncharacterized membrane protein
MSTTDPSAQPTMSDKQIALIVYVLYFAGYITGITTLIGVIIAHVKVADADPLLRTHYQFQIRTFWIGLLYLAIGAVLLFVVVGIAVWLWWFIWSLVRNVKACLRSTRTSRLPTRSRGCSVERAPRRGRAYYRLISECRSVEWDR